MSQPGHPPSVEVEQQRLGAVISERYRIEKLERAEPAYYAYRAVEIGSGRLVMAYQVLAHIAQRKGYLDRFQSDVRKLQRLRSHPAFPEVLDSFAESPEQCYLITTYPAVTDVSLAKQLDRGLPLPLAKALQHLGLLGDALEAAHREGLMHFHLSPDRILLSDDEKGERTLRVLGFGLLQQGADALSPKSVSEYLAPEQLRNEPTDARTDQFVLAAIGYEMLSGRKAFAQRGDTQAQIRERILREDPLPIPLSHTRENFINSALNKAFSKARQQRHATVRDLCFELGLADEPPKNSAPHVETRPRRRSWRRALLMVTLLLSIGAVGALGVVVRGRIHHPKRPTRVVRPVHIAAKPDMAAPVTPPGEGDIVASVDMRAEHLEVVIPVTHPDLGVPHPHIPPPPPPLPPPPSPPPLPPQFVFRYEPEIKADKRAKLEQCLRGFSAAFSAELTLLSGKYRVSSTDEIGIQRSDGLRRCLDQAFAQGDLPDPLTIKKEKRGR